MPQKMPWEADYYPRTPSDIAIVDLGLPDEDGLS